MKTVSLRALVLFVSFFGLAAFGLAACSDAPTLPSADISASNTSYDNSSEYKIGPGDTLNIIVWHNPDLSGQVPVRPDGRISIALIGDVVAAGKRPMDLGAEIQTKLTPYIKDALVTVSPTSFIGPFAMQVRVIGEATQPRAIPYNSKMTLLDVMIAVGGLTRYADGNRAEIVRVGKDGEQQTYSVYLDSLIRDGNVSDNVAMQPGDILIIPQRFF